MESIREDMSPELSRVLYTRLANAAADMLREGQYSGSKIDWMNQVALFALQGGERGSKVALDYCQLCCISNFKSKAIGSAVFFGNEAMKLGSQNNQLIVCLAQAILEKNPYNEWQQVIDLLEPFLKTNKEDIEDSHVLVMLALAFAYGSKTQEALEYADVVFNKRDCSPLQLANAKWAAGFAFLRDKRPKEGRECCLEGIEIAKKDLDLNHDSTVEILCKLYNVLASNAMSLGLESEAEDALSSSHELAKGNGLKLSQAICLGMHSKILIGKFSKLKKKNYSLLKKAKEMVLENERLNKELGAAIGLLVAPQRLIEIARMEENFQGILNYGHSLIERGELYVDDSAVCIGIAALVEAKLLLKEDASGEFQSLCQFLAKTKFKKNQVGLVKDALLLLEKNFSLKFPNVIEDA